MAAELNPELREKLVQALRYSLNQFSGESDDFGPLGNSSAGSWLGMGGYQPLEDMDDLSEVIGREVRLNEVEIRSLLEGNNLPDILARVQQFSRRELEKSGLTPEIEELLNKLSTISDALGDDAILNFNADPSSFNQYLQYYGLSLPESAVDPQLKVLNTIDDVRDTPHLRGVISTEPNFAAQSPSIAGETIAQQEAALQNVRDLVSLRPVLRDGEGNPMLPRGFWQVRVPVETLDEDKTASLLLDVGSYLEDRGFRSGRDFRYLTETGELLDDFIDENDITEIVLNAGDRDVAERITALIQRKFGMRIPESSFESGVLNPVGNLGMNFNLVGAEQHDSYFGLERGIPIFQRENEDWFGISLEAIRNGPPDISEPYYGSSLSADIFPNVRKYLRLSDLETSETFKARTNARYVSLKSGRAVPVIENHQPRIMGGLGRAKDVDLESILKMEDDLAEYTGSIMQGLSGELDLKGVPLNIRRALRNNWEETVGFPDWISSGRVGLQWMTDPATTIGRPFARARIHALDILGAPEWEDAAHNIWAATGYMELDPGGFSGDPTEYIRSSNNRVTGRGVERLFNQATNTEVVDAAQTVVVMDLETTGLGSQDGVWQISLRKIDKATNEEIDKATYYLKHPRHSYGVVPLPGGGEEDYFTNLTRTIEQQVGHTIEWDEKTIPQILEELITRFDGDILALHNGGFDIQHIVKWVTQPGVDPALRGRVMDFLTEKASRGAIRDTRRMTQIIAGTIDLGVNPEIIRAERGITPISIQNIVLETDLIERMRASGELSEDLYRAVLRGDFHNSDLDTAITYGLNRRIDEMVALRPEALTMRAQGRYDDFAELIHEHVLSTRRNFETYLGENIGDLTGIVSGSNNSEMISNVISNIAHSGANVPIGKKFEGLTAFEHLVRSQRSLMDPLVRRTIGLPEMMTQPQFSILNELQSMGFLRGFNVQGENKRGFQSLTGYMPNREEFAALRQRAASGGYQYINLGLPEMQATAALGRLPIENLGALDPLNQVQLAMGEQMGLGSFTATRELRVFGENQNIVQIPAEILDAAMQNGHIRHWRQAGLTLDHFDSSAGDLADNLTKRSVALKYTFESKEEQENFFKFFRSLTDSELESFGFTREQATIFGRQAESVGFSEGVQIGINREADELHGFLDALAPKSANDVLPWRTRFVGIEDGNIITAGAYLDSTATDVLKDELDEIGSSFLRLRAEAAHEVTVGRALPSLMANTGSSSMDAAARAANSSATANEMSDAAARARALLNRTVDEDVLRGVEASYERFKGKAPLLLAGAAAAALGYYVFRRKRWEQTYNATVEMQPFEDDRPSAPDPVIAFGPGSRMSPMATSALVDNLYQNRIGHSNMAPDRHKYLFGSGY